MTTKPGTVVLATDRDGYTGPAMWGHNFNRSSTLFIPGPGHDGTVTPGWSNGLTHPSEDWQAVTVSQMSAEISVGDGGTAIVTAEHPDLGTVAVYEYVDPDGDRYLVVDIDHESDTPPVRVYLNDAPIYRSEA